MNSEPQIVVRGSHCIADNCAADRSRARANECPKERLSPLGEKNRKSVEPFSCSLRLMIKGRMDRLSNETRRSSCSSAHSFPA